MKFRKSSALALAAMILAGCRTIPLEVKDSLEKEPDCRTAEHDIAVLESERASVLKQAMAGAGAVMPSSAVIGLLSGDYPDRVKVASGQYNKDIEAKIAQIKAACPRYKQNLR